WVRRRSDQDLERLRKLDVRVVGDLEELRGKAVPGVHTSEVTSDQQLEAALDGLAFMLTRSAKSRAATDTGRETKPEAEPEPEPEPGPKLTTSEEATP
ncbi:MAG: hypothetical protein ABIN79_10340, partial [Marmoricola sp.]